MALFEFGDSNRPKIRKTCVSRGEPAIYVEEDNPERIIGEVRIVRGWNALGRKVSLLSLRIMKL
jgi:hypothetical protein